MTREQANRNNRAIERMNARKRATAERIFAIQMIFVLIVFLAFGAISIWAIGEMAIERNVRYNYTTTTLIEVQQGDTLWTIAENARICQRQDLRQIVWLIQQQNGLRDALIFPNDILAVPVFDNLPAE